MVNELVKLKEKREILSKNVKKLEYNKDLYVTNVSNDIERLIVANNIDFSNLSLNSSRISLSFTSNSVFKKSIIIEPVFSEGSIRFSINWSSGKHNTDLENSSIKYINAVHFIMNLMEIKQSELYVSIKDFFVSLKDKDKKIKKAYNELQLIEFKIRNLELKIKKDSFYKNLKGGNFYYTYVKKRRYSKSYYHIAYIEKVNPVTSNVYFFKSTNIESVKYNMDNITNLIRKRIRNNELFSKLLDHSIFTKDNFEDIITKHQIKINMIKIYKDLDIDHIKDMKKLCNTLFKFNAIDKQIPDNNILSIISEKRHHLLKYGHTE